MMMMARAHALAYHLYTWKVSHAPDVTNGPTTYFD